MKIFAIMLVKNEADIVKSVLLSAREWADKIFVIDNDSTDGTWEIVNSLADDVIIIERQEKRTFNRDFRGEVFEKYKALATKDDWWAFALDSDEFYVDNPKEFLAKVPGKFHIVNKKSLDYVITKEDLQEYEFTGDFEKDKGHLKYIKNPCWCEPRFFRHRDAIQWEFGKSQQCPHRLGVHYPEYIIVKHYQNRSPKQMQRRLDLRNSLPEKKDGRCFHHVKETDFHELLGERKNCVYDTGEISLYHDNKILIPNNPVRQSILKKFALRAGIALGKF